MLRATFIALITSGMLGVSRGFQSGAPASACLSMYPGHLAQRQDQSSNPYVLTVDSDSKTYSANETLKVSLRAPEGVPLIKGFLLQARTVSGLPSGPVGTFASVDKNTQSTCEHGGLTQKIWRAQQEFVGVWKAPPKGLEDDIYFVATVVQNFRTFWMDVRSDIFTHFVPPPPVPLSDCNVTEACTEELLKSLPAERPHVAMLCSAHNQCPCGWLCCPSCVDGKCMGHAICRQPLETVDKNVVV